MVHDHYSPPLSSLDLQIISNVSPGGNWRDLPVDFPSARVRKIRTSYPQGGGSRSTYYGRLQWNRPAYTINTYFSRPGNGCFIHPEEDRLVTMREAARLQSFPDAYRFRGSVRSRHVQIGNAVPPIMAYHLASALPRGAVVDLFCGAGGLALGFEWAGFRTVLAVDNDQAALRSFADNRPGGEAVTAMVDLATREGIDRVTALARDRLGSERPQVVVGGPPCQGISTAGKCAMDDPRNGLVTSFLAVVERLEPDFVLLENVPALLWRRRSHILSEILLTLRRQGFHSAIMVGHAETFGVPQLRRRLFVLSSRTPSTLAWPRACRRMLPPSFSKYQQEACAAAAEPFTVEDAIADLPRGSVADPDSVIDYAAPPASPYQRWSRGEIPLKELTPPVDVRPAEVQLPLTDDLRR